MRLTETNATGGRLHAGGLRSWVARYGLITALVGLCALLSWLAPTFLTLQNWIIVIRQISINGILAVGVTYVLLTGGVDLSLGSMVALTGVVAASFAHPGEYPLIVPVVIGVATGMLGGMVNGLIVTQGRVAPFIVTLGMMTAARGLALVISGGKPVSNLSGSFTSIGRSNWLGIPIPIIILIVVSALSYLMLINTRLGRYIYAVGGNENAARASGIRVNAVKTFAYAVCGAMAGLAGVVLASRITTGQPNAGLAYELDAIADALQAVKDGRLDATVFQDARGQGGIAVETVVKILRHEPFERQVFIPFQLVTRDNVDQYLK